MVRRSTTIGAGLAAIALVLAGCGGKTAASDEAATADTSTATASASADVDPCSLLSAAEMTAITTDAVTDTSSEDGTCTYRSNPDQTVTVTARTRGGKDAMATVHRAAGLLGGMGAAVADKGGAGADVANMLKKDETPGPAIGDEAVWGMNTMLSVRKGDAFVEVTPPIMHDPATHSGYPLVKQDEKRTIALAIAQKVLAKLP